MQKRFDSDSPEAERSTQDHRSRTAGLALSVGSASLGVRVMLAIVLLVVALIAIVGGAYIAAAGPLSASLVAAAAIVPFGMIACVAALFVLAPSSRFGRWIDRFVGVLSPGRGAAVVGVLWTIAAVVARFASRLW